MTMSDQADRKNHTRPARMATRARPLAQAASLTIDSFSAAAFAMSPANPTFMSGW